MKSHHNLSQDVGANAAGGEAIKGAAIGSAKVQVPHPKLMLSYTDPIAVGRSLRSFVGHRKCHVSSVQRSYASIQSFYSDVRNDLGRLPRGRSTSTLL